MANSAIFPIFLRAEYRNDGKGFSQFQSEAARAAQAAKREFQGVEAALDQALSRRRNASGSLDLGVDELRQAAAAQQQVATAAREVAEATKRAATANGQFDQSLSRSTRAAFELANAEERVSREMLAQVTALEAVQRELDQVASKTDLVTQANRRGQAASAGAVASQGALRTASVQAGQQLQDIVVQMEMGTRATTIFAQQVPQLAFALTGLQDSTNATQRRIGTLAAFLAGPWGAAVFAGTAILGPYIARLFEAGKAADQVKFSSDGLASAQGILGSAIDIATGRINQQSEALRNLAAAQILAGQVESARRQAELRTQLGTAAQERGERISGPLGLPILNVRPGAGIGSLDGFLRRPSESAAVVRSFLDGNTGASKAIDQLRALERAGKITQERLLDLSATIANLGVEQRNSEIFAASERLLQGNATGADRQLLLRPERGARSRGSGTAEGAQARELAQVQRLAESAAERVARINERFDAQPRMIDAAAQATRELDDIIADLEKRKPVNWEALVAEAQKAKGTIRQALAGPVEEVIELSRERLQIEGLIAQGQIDEALALREILRLQDQIGELTEDQKEDIRAQIRFEQERTRELRAQAELLDLQANVARQVATSLRDVLSGRSTDFFGDFRQAIQDLQGARLFEQFFGPAFRSLEQELAGNTPQGRANQAYVRAVNEAASTTTRLEGSLGRLSDAVDTAAARIAGGVPANDNLPTAGSPWAMVRMAALGAAGIGGGITVLGNRPQPVEFAQRSVREIAEEIAKATVKPGVELLSRLIGRELAGAVGAIAAGVIAGQARAGTTGAVLGGLEQLTGQIKGLENVSKVFGKALGGAETGTQVAGITKAIGLPSNSTGAQIGGAIGQFIPIPGGDIIGAVVGNFLGALVAGIPKGSATVNGSSVLGVVGNRGSLRDAASDLGSRVNDVVANVARQLGGRVGAASSPVSIGMREEDFRVDPTGRGTTRVAGGAIDFGKDQEAAVRFAAQTLIERGVIAGIKDSEQRLLRAGKSLEDGIRDVLDFRGVFDRLKEIRDPVGFAVERLNRDFERMIELFDRASASAEEFAKLRDLYDLERARAIEDANERITGALSRLLSDLRIGDNGLSLRSRRANALGQFEGLAARVAAGDSTAFDDFADISKQLLDIERQLFGSTQSYFDRLAQITALTEKAVADQTNVTSMAAAQGSPFPERAEIVRGIDIMTNELASRLDAIIANQIAVAQIAQRGPSSNGSGGASGGGLVDFGFVPAVANF